MQEYRESGDGGNTGGSSKVERGLVHSKTIRLLYFMLTATADVRDSPGKEDDKEKIRKELRSSERARIQ